VAAIKLQWWKDTVDECMKGASPNHPVAIALAESMQNVKLSKTWFNKIIDSRVRPFVTPMPELLLLNFALLRVYNCTAKGSYYYTT
jgi:phytoene/squalene synthetase